MVGFLLKIYSFEFRRNCCCYNLFCKQNYLQTLSKYIKYKYLSRQRLNNYPRWWKLSNPLPCCGSFPPAFRSLLGSLTMALEQLSRHSTSRANHLLLYTLYRTTVFASGFGGSGTSEEGAVTRPSSSIPSAPGTGVCLLSPPAPSPPPARR